MLGRFAAGICCSKQTPQIFWHSKHIIIHTTTYWHKIWGLSSDSPPKRTVVLWKLSILIESLKSNTTGSNPRAVPGLSLKEHCYFGVVCARHCKKSAGVQYFDGWMFAISVLRLFLRATGASATEKCRTSQARQVRGRGRTLPLDGGRRARVTYG